MLKFMKMPFTTPLARTVLLVCLCLMTCQQKFYQSLSNYYNEKARVILSFAEPTDKNKTVLAQDAVKISVGVYLHEQILLDLLGSDYYPSLEYKEYNDQDVIGNDHSVASDQLFKSVLELTICVYDASTGDAFIGDLSLHDDENQTADIKNIQGKDGKGYIFPDKAVSCVLLKDMIRSYFLSTEGSTVHNDKRSFGIDESGGGSEIAVKIGYASLHLAGYNPASLLFKAFVFRSTFDDEEYSEFIVAQENIFFDVLSLGKLSDHFNPVRPDLIHKERELSMKNTMNICDAGAPMRDKFIVLIFFKDLEVHGCNQRLLRFACHHFDSDKETKHIEVNFLLGSEDGPILHEIESCEKMRYFAPILYKSSIEESAESEVFILSTELLELLSMTNFIVAANTHGDDQTDLLIRHVQYMKSHVANRSPPRMVLDLCNLISFTPKYEERWVNSVDGYIAPSVFVSTHPANQLVKFLTQKEALIEVVYPAVSTKLYQVAEARKKSDSKKSWPRRNKRFTVGCMGRHSTERSPSLCIRAINAAKKLYERSLYLSDDRKRKGTFEERFRFLLFGKGPLLNHMIALIEELDLDDTVEVLGFISEKGFLENLQELDLAVFSMIRGENFGILQAEATVMGIPVLAFNSSASQESLLLDSSSLIDPKRCKSFATSSKGSEYAFKTGPENGDNSGSDLCIQALARGILASEEVPESIGIVSESIIKNALVMQSLMHPAKHAERFIAALQRIALSSP